jgi:transcription initiation factor IIE alpha subunit
MEKKLGAVCPECGETLTELLNVQSGEKSFRFRLVKSGKMKGLGKYADYGFEPNCVTNDWICPECNEVIATDEEKAIDFLKGKSEGND